MRACRSAEGIVVYYCVSDFEQLAGDPAVRRSEAELLSLADLVFVDGTHLRDRFTPRHPRVRVFPYGASLDACPPSVTGGEPADLAAIKRPRVGYIGLIQRHLALDWLVRAATSLSRYSFVFVGPREPDVDARKLEALPNVHFLDARDQDALAGYVAGFDVCLIPHVRSAYTESVVPTKLYEYLALGRPVVSSDLPEIVAELDRRMWWRSEPTTLTSSRRSSGRPRGRAT